VRQSPRREMNRRSVMMKQLVDSDETSSRWRPRVTAQVIKQMYTLVVSSLLLLGGNVKLSGKVDTDHFKGFTPGVSYGRKRSDRLLYTRS